MARRTLARLPNREYTAPPAQYPLFTVKDRAITIHASDAHPIYHPSLASRSPDKYRWFRADPAEENEWKRKCGYHLAKGLDLEGRETEPGWRVERWPSGYALFLRVDITMPNDRGMYMMCGSTFLQTGRPHRTTSGFAKHLEWLCRLGHDLSLECGCKPCCMRATKADYVKAFVVWRKTPRTPLSSSSSHVGPSRILAPTAEPYSAVSEAASSTTSDDRPLLSYLHPPDTSYAQPSTHVRSVYTNGLAPPPLPSFKRQADLSRMSDSSASSSSRLPAPLAQSPHDHAMQEDESTESAAQRRKRKGKQRAVEPDDFAGLDAPMQLDEPPVSRRPGRSTRNTNPVYTSAPLQEAEVEPTAALTEYPGPYVNKNRYFELSNHIASYRLLELAWYSPEKLGRPPPFKPGRQLLLWPVIIRERHLSVKTTVNRTGDGPPELHNIQTYTYEVELLGTINVVSTDASHLVPFNSFQPHSFPGADGLPFPRDFDTFATWRDAEDAWLAGLEAARHIAISFTPFLEIDGPLQANTRWQDLQDAKAGKASQATLHKLDTQELSYQGLFWGPEKIWVGELVRLIGQWIVEPSGVYLQFDAEAEVRLDGLEASEQRAPFFRIDAIRRNKHRDTTIEGVFYEMVDEREASKEYVRLPQELYISPAVDGYVFRPVKGSSEEEKYSFSAAVIAGRYYQLGTLSNDWLPVAAESTLSGMRNSIDEHSSCPEDWHISRRRVIKAARGVA